MLVDKPPSWRYNSIDNVVDNVVILSRSNRSVDGWTAREAAGRSLKG